MSDYPLIVAGAPAEEGPDLRAIVVAAGYLIAVDRGADVCRSAGRMPDLFVGDADSVSAETFAWLSSAGVRTVLLDADKDETDLDAAFDEAGRLGLRDVRVTCVTGGRTDHALVAIGGLLRAARLRPVLLEPLLSGWVLGADHRSTLRLTGPGATFSVLAGPEGAEVSIEGARWPLDHAALRPLDSLGVSNAVAGEVASVIVHSGLVLVLTSPVEGVAPAAELPEA